MTNGNYPLENLPSRHCNVTPEATPTRPTERAAERSGIESGTEQNRSVNQGQGGPAASPH